MNDYKILFNKISLPDEAVSIFDAVYKRVVSEAGFYADYINVRDKYFGGDCSFKYIAALAEKYSIEPYGLALAFTILYSATMRRNYCEKGYDEEIFYDSLRDLTIWSKVCRRDFGVWGLREYDWLSNQLRCEIFRLGRLQFHYQKFECDSFTKSGHTVRRGDTVINMHIPEGDPLTVESRLDAYRRAYEFFCCGTFVCDSWLLYPKHEQFLPKNSNVLSFMHDFDIIKDSESGDLHNMWRIWGRHENYDPQTLARDTSFRRAYADWLSETGKTGDGYGVFFFDGMNIIK
ncbi:MAG: acyltransferase domain-containing protein [Eubacteriales bacterium]